ncbi:3-phosphoshikimate 1-carboxyvinyltransferase [Ignatzschineria cameli]|uniref:3-phosphoshikimate 1-carboxyvinyltransferase n=1 Tax=Ignatzschineria cameli TaxID=2182793 RepID=A0A2U2APZ2_9GAMM|nr:3-phosphoshikimate 1-carboxyvinyltransferase [Ignatzschineria cameli]PWD83399.1 3-phosphoshikimate 1-carboxyvinyltransferase [Ignatzschineria cameli]PWD85517.1 3-phosphoshikimate 1-carboxyvinyltransferase [Ignatzschineria cameli]PWD89169.1 3-phosphoshikimate 1-carboxyvinyltransferase [Ignatzschineria cameli]PWD90657.1 3-phosphoshikimate 1-carboxyvinyltransferase [Ignatzschineria cameli]PWD91361.1 3-phosphoshikimate 1-carboxyvinyltransferase [Ignatzschineria cameli]
MMKLNLPQISAAAGSVTIPGSKSISNRILLLAALTEGMTTIINLLESDDTERMLEALSTLGVDIVEKDPVARIFEVRGSNSGFPNKCATLFLGNAGTAFRSLTAAVALNQGEYELTGIPRMHERPIKDLVDALRALGGNVEYLENEGYPPLKIGKGNFTAERISIKGDVSSQYLTALLIALPLLKREITIDIEGVLISKPYIEITLTLLRQFGIEINHHHYQSFMIPADGTFVTPGTFFVESDASSASYFLALGALAGPLTVKGVGTASIQGDIRFVDALIAMGAEVKWGENEIFVSRPQKGSLRGIDLDCNHIPDAAMTLAILAVFAKGKTILRNIGSWRVKETDRIAAMATELTKVGVKVEEGEDYLVIYPQETITPNIEIETYDDHRIAMCFSLLSLKAPITILDPQCVDKTFPTYFELFSQVTK